MLLRQRMPREPSREKGTYAVTIKRAEYKIDTKGIYAEVYKVDGHDYGRTTEGNRYENGSWQLVIAPKLTKVMKYLRRYVVGSDARVVEIGCGLGDLNSCHPKWEGYEYSATAIELAREIHGPTLRISEADARCLPIENSAVDFLFSIETLEHVPSPEVAFSEIERVLKPSGLAMLSPAWNCRPWTVKKLQQRTYSELPISDRIGKLLIPLRNSLFFRFAVALPGRLKREALLALNRSPIALQYRNLEPDFSLWARYPHISDDDAFVSIDAHAAITYFASRGWEVLSHRSMARRLACRGEEIVVRKPSTHS